MGSSYNCKITVHGNDEEERNKILKMLLDCEYIAPAVGKWTGDWKGYYPNAHVKSLSNECKKTYILVRTVQYDCPRDPYVESIYYGGIGMNALYPGVNRESPISAVKALAKELKAKAS